MESTALEVAQLAGGHGRLEIGVREGDEADVDADRTDGASGPVAVGIDTELHRQIAAELSESVLVGAGVTVTRSWSSTRTIASPS